MTPTNMLGIRIIIFFASKGGAGVNAGVIDVDITYAIESSSL